MKFCGCALVFEWLPVCGGAAAAMLKCVYVCDFIVSCGACDLLEIASELLCDLFCEREHECCGSWSSVLICDGFTLHLGRGPPFTWGGVHPSLVRVVCSTSQSSCRTWGHSPIGRRRRNLTSG